VTPTQQWSPLQHELCSLAFHAHPILHTTLAALAGLYLPEATIIDGSRKGEKLATVSGAELSSYLSQQPYLTELQLTVTKVNAEVEYDGGELKTIHAQFDFSHVAGRFRVYRRLVQTPGGWKVGRARELVNAPQHGNPTRVCAKAPLQPSLPMAGRPRATPAGLAQSVQLAAAEARHLWQRLHGDVSLRGARSRRDWFACVGICCQIAFSVRVTACSRAPCCSIYSTQYMYIRRSGIAWDFVSNES
jgi:hypothetical protein